MNEIIVFFKSLWYKRDPFTKIFYVIVVSWPIAEFIVSKKFDVSLLFCIVVIALYVITHIVRSKYMKIVWETRVLPKWQDGDNEKRLISMSIKNWKVFNILLYVVIIGSILSILAKSYLDNQSINIFLSLVVWFGYFIGVAADRTALICVHELLSIKK